MIITESTFFLWTSQARIPGTVLSNLIIAIAGNVTIILLLHTAKPTLFSTHRFYFGPLSNHKRLAATKIPLPGRQIKPED